MLELSITEARRLIAAGELSAVALAEAYLARIAAYDDALNAFRTVTADLALEQARAVDEAVERGDVLGPLAGIPVALKDNIDVAGVRRTAGSAHLADSVAGEDAPVWQRLRDAGAVLLGKLHMSEWAIGVTTQNVHFGPCRNAWDPARVSGGSSGGSGVAVAAGMAAAALGTDTGGSIRIPSALNGICGLRPTVGRVSNRGSIPVSWTFDTIGPMARRAEDAAAVLDVIAGYDPADPVSSAAPVPGHGGALDEGVAGLRVGLLTGYWLDAAEPGVAASVREAAATLERLGAQVGEAELTGQEEAAQCAGDLLLAEAAAYHAERLARIPEIFADDVLSRLRRGAAVTGPRYGEGRQMQRVWTRRVSELLDSYDVLLTPGCPIPAPLIAESDSLAMTAVLGRFFSMWVLSRNPALAVPCGFSAGLPVGMQLLGRPFAEPTLLRVAHAYQRETRWHLQRPSALSLTPTPNPDPIARTS